MLQSETIRESRGGGIFHLPEHPGVWIGTGPVHAFPKKFLPQDFSWDPYPNFLENKNRAVGLLAPGLRQ